MKKLSNVITMGLVWGVVSAVDTKKTPQKSPTVGQIYPVDKIHSLVYECFRLQRGYCNQISYDCQNYIAECMRASLCKEYDLCEDKSFPWVTVIFVVVATCIIVIAVSFGIIQYRRRKGKAICICHKPPSTNRGVIKAVVVPVSLSDKKTKKSEDVTYDENSQIALEDSNFKTVPL